MSLTKIDDAELFLQNRFHENQPDVPKINATEMKKFFDYIPRQVIIPKLNELVDEINKVIGDSEQAEDFAYSIAKTNELLAKKLSIDNLIGIDPATLTQAGYYYIENAVNTPFESGHFIVLNADGELSDRKIIAISTNDDSFYIRTMTGGEWQDWPSPKEYSDETFPDCKYILSGDEREWINPPMVLNTEYRTTERFEGKAVYVKVIDCGTLPNDTTKRVAHGIENVNVSTSIIFFDVIAISSQHIQQFPFVNLSGELQGKIFFSKNYIEVVSFADLSGYNAKCFVKYTK